MAASGSRFLDLDALGVVQAQEPVQQRTGEGGHPARPVGARPGTISPPRTPQRGFWWVFPKTPTWSRWATTGNRGVISHQDALGDSALDGTRSAAGLRTSESRRPATGQARRTVHTSKVGGPGQRPGGRDLRTGEGGRPVTGQAAHPARHPRKRARRGVMAATGSRFLGLDTLSAVHENQVQRRTSARADVQRPARPRTRKTPRRQCARRGPDHR